MFVDMECEGVSYIGDGFVESLTRSLECCFGLDES